MMPCGHLSLAIWAPILRLWQPKILLAQGNGFGPVMSKKRETHPTQLDLFQNFLCNNEVEKHSLSNSIDLWDILPKYSVSRKETARLRDENGHLGLLELSCIYRQQEFTVTIQPTLVDEEVNGCIMVKSYYPSAAEEIVEDALRKLAVAGGNYNAEHESYGVHFTRYQLRQELRRCGHSRTLQDINKSLLILSGSVIQIKGQGLSRRSTLRSTYLSNLVITERKDLKDDNHAKCYAIFHPFVSSSIDALKFRQFNYDRLMRHSRQLSRWLHKLLLDKYEFASAKSNFTLKYSTVKRDSHLLDAYARETSAIEECDHSLQELVDNRVLDRFEKIDERGAKNKILDVRYTLYASDEFVAEVKAANGRRLAKLIQAGEASKLIHRARARSLLPESGGHYR